MYVGHDVGTTGTKTVLVDLDGMVHAQHVSGYALRHGPGGVAEQDPADWWAAVCEGTRAVLAGRDEVIGGLCFAGQMLALVPMKADGTPTRPAISWLDHRAEQQARRLVRRMGGSRMVNHLAGGVPTGKDLVPKVAWLAAHEPDVHAATVGYGDATSYLVAKATGRLAIDPTAAGGTGMLDLKRRRWSRIVAKLVGFPLRKMPELVASSAVAGTVHSRAAQELGVPVGTPVAMGMADIPAAAVGSGAVRPGAAHLYIGTSSWVGVCIPRPISLPAAGIATAPSAQDQGCLLIAESETAGACRDWIGAQLGLDTPEELAAQVPPGSDGLLFCPWMYGERSPVPDPLVRGAFVNLSLAHGRAHMARAVLEGVALNTAWVLGAIDRTGCRSPSLRAIGGGAKSDLWMQIMADATGESVVRMAAPQLSGAVGAGLMAAVAVGDLACVEDIADRVVPERTFTPDPTVSAVMERQLAIMQQIAPALSRAGRP